MFSPTHLEEAGPSCAALKLVLRRVRRQAAHGAIVRPGSLGVVLEAVRIPPREGGFRAPPDNVSLHHVKLLLLSGGASVIRVSTIQYTYT